MQLAFVGDAEGEGQGEAVEAIEESEWSVAYDWQFDANGDFCQNSRLSSPHEPQWLLGLVGDDFFGDIIEVVLNYREEVTDTRLGTA